MAQRLLPNSNLQPEDLSGLTVLVVDDHVNTQRLMRDVLQAGGVGRVETAGDGQRAREALLMVQPDIIFTDGEMPVMNGVEMCRSIRRAAVIPDPKVPDPKVPIIMVTSARSERDVRVARLAGINEFVLKPFTPAALLSRIQLVLRKPREFIVSDSYVGPDRRRKLELNYSGPLRRGADGADTVTDSFELEVTRGTIRVELEAMRKLIAARGGVDRALARMAYRVMQHTRFRAQQVSDRPLEQRAEALIRQVDAEGGLDICRLGEVERLFGEVMALLAVSDPQPTRQALAS
jgi:CheY-like chemotaxis protein